MSRITFLLGAMLIGLGAAICYVLVKPALFIVILSGGGLALFYACLSPAARKDMGYRPALVAALMPVAAWLLPSIWLLYAVMLMLVPVMARRGGQAPALYLFALMLLPALDQGIAIGSLKLFSFGVHDALACGAAVSLLIHPEWRARGRLALDLPFLALFCLLVIAGARDTSITNMLRVFVDTGLDCALPYYIVSRGLRDKADVQRLLLHLSAAAAVLSVILLYEFVKSWPMYNVLIDHYALPDHPLVKSRGSMLRAGGPFLESTSIAMVLVFCFLAAWVARPAFRSGLFHGALLCLLLAGLIPPQSRGAWIGLLIGMAMVDLYRARLRRTALRLGVVGMVGVLLFAAAQTNQQLSEMFGLSGGSVDTVDYREMLLTRGLEELGHRPLTGYSYPELLVRLDDLRQGEGIVDFVNTHLFIALLSGVFGLALFNGVFLFHLARLWQIRRRLVREGDNASRAAALVFAGLITPLQMLFFTSLGGRVQVVLFVFLALSTAVGRTRNAPQSAGRLLGQPGPIPSNAPSFAFASNPMAAPPAPAASSSSSARGLSSPIRYSANQP